VIVMRQEDGFTILHGRKESEWVIAPWWPCSGAAIRKIAPDKLPKEFVEEAACFADTELNSGRY
jgi:hypothetical protein